MLGLHYATPAAWAQQALQDPAQLMLDHLFCERKAAAMALHTLRVEGKRFPKLKQLMTDLANEEFEHAELCEKFLKEMRRPKETRGGNLYALQLRKLWKARGHDQFLDMLLVSSLIEARSAERFKLLADATNGTTLGNFYGDLYASEVNHYLLFVSLGVDIFGEEMTMKRLEEMRADEAKIIQSLPQGSRIHSGFHAE
jgi:tRNA 2-(methylsulfanyl)-N6-isopentenyladenosine37 hydroxylase